MIRLQRILIATALQQIAVQAFLVSPQQPQQQQQHRQSYSPKSLTTRHAIDEDWESDFDDFDTTGDGSSEDGSSLKLSDVLQSRGAQDLSSCRVRQLSLGRDFVLDSFLGNMGFDEVTDWEYYYQNEEDEDDRKVVQPNPFDSATPRRTRSSSGSVVRYPIVFLLYC